MIEQIPNNQIAEQETVRQVVLDTETTGLDARTERIIEIGCIEMVNRRITHRTFHEYINPMMVVGQGAIDVHGITNEFLSDKPLFADVVYPFLDFVRGAELVIHNASFDIGFLNMEMQNFDPALGKLEDYCTVVDSLAMAREIFPGQRNDLDTLAKRYGVDNSHRKLHGALLDSEILADVYLLMSGGQHDLELESVGGASGMNSNQNLDYSIYDLPVLKANEAEEQRHKSMINNMEGAGNNPLWSRLFDQES